MVQLRKNEFKDLLEMNELLFEDKDKFIHCDIPTLGKVTYYPKANKIQISRTNTWEENGFEFVKNILGSTKKTSLIYENTSLVKSNDKLYIEFAGLAMQAICVNAGRNSFDFNQPDRIAEYAYLIADSMIKKYNSKPEFPKDR